MKIVRGSHCLIAASLLALTAFATGTVAQTRIKPEPARMTNAWTGDQLYKEFCAVCHGVDGKGSGPAASALKATASDLTQFTRRNEGKFPDLKMRAIINSGESIGAHGTSEMPMWGDIFKSISANQTFGQMRVDALVKYIQSIQR